MEHVLFARFPDLNEARTTLAKVRTAAGRDVRIHVHTGAADDAVFDQMIEHSGDLAETDLRHALVVGVVSGGLAGIVCAVLLALIGIFPGTVLQAVWFGALMGILVGLLMMSIFGSGLMDARLRRLTRGLRAGEVVATFETRDREQMERVAAVVEAAGGQVAHKSVA